MKKSLITITILLLLFYIPVLFAQKQGQELIDSLQKELPKMKEDTNKVKVYEKISFTYYNINPDKGIKYGEKALSLSQKLKWRFGEAISLNAIGITYYQKSEYFKSLECHKKALKIYQELSNNRGIASSLGNIGNTYSYLSEYDRALDYLQKSLEIYELIGNKKGIASLLLNIGSLYSTQNNDKALEYYLKALKIFDELDNSYAKATLLGNIGNKYALKSNYVKALEYNNKSKDIYKKIGSKLGVAGALHNIGVIYYNQLDIDQALEYYQKSLKIYLELNNKRGEARIFNSLSELYYTISIDSIKNKIKNTTEYVNLQKDIILSRSITYSQNSINISKEIGEKYLQQLSLFHLYQAYLSKKDYKNAFESYHEYVQMNDTINSQETQTKIANLEAKRENELLQKDMEKLKIDNEYQAEISYYLSAVAILAVVSIIIGFFFYRNKRRSNRWLSAKNKVIQDANIELDTLNTDLADKNQQIVHANIELDTLNTDLASKNYEISEANEKITSSITYASNIQTAMLPFPSRMKEILHDYFVLYIPKDIVSGDFYWIEKIEGKIFIVVADCTGHGVPGAFMSMIGNELLNNIVIKQRIFDPAQVLSEMHKDVRFALKQEESESKTPDGMDVCMCVIENNKLTFAGAKRPLYIVQNGIFEEIKGDRKPIGGRQKEEDRTFTNNEIELQSGMMIYLTTDGYQDQHNINQKKYGVKRFRELLQSIADKPMEEQKNLLESKLNEFSQGEKNRDDIAVMGVKL